MAHIDDTATHNFSASPSPSPLWRGLLRAITIGKTAIGGTGTAIALLGLINSLVLIVSATDIAPAPHWQTSFQSEEHLFQYFAGFGATAGGILGWIMSRSR
jgi:hypothetical protein